MGLIRQKNGRDYVSYCETWNWKVKDLLMTALEKSPGHELKAVRQRVDRFNER